MASSEVGRPPLHRPYDEVLFPDYAGYAVLHEPVAEGDESLRQLTLDERLQRGLQVRRLEGNEGEVEGAFEAALGRRGRRGEPAAPRPHRRAGDQGRASSRRAPRWRRGRLRVAPRPPSSPPPRRRWRRPRLRGRSRLSWGVLSRIDGRQVLKKLVQRRVAPVALQEQPLPLFVGVLEEAGAALGARASLSDEVS